MNSEVLAADLLGSPSKSWVPQAYSGCGTPHFVGMPGKSVVAGAGVEWLG